MEAQQRPSQSDKHPSVVCCIFCRLGANVLLIFCSSQTSVQPDGMANVAKDTIRVSRNKVLCTGRNYLAKNRILI